MSAAATSSIDRATMSADETAALGAELARVARPGDLLCLWGDLGAGKTVFAKGFGAGLGIEGVVSSPSFILMAEYVGRLPLFHVDLYRLDDASDVLAGGLLDERQAEGVTLVEWPERMGAALPAERLDVRIDGSGEERRRIRLEAHGPAAEAYVRALRATASTRAAAPAAP
jgi:tRNA threonylcarbamoyladenosine biosynthesis protein TsaE